MNASIPGQIEEARERASSHLLAAAEQADLAARAEQLGDLFGASWFARQAHDSIRRFWKAHVDLRNQIEGARTCR
jgi:hypothetical protein